MHSQSSYHPPPPHQAQTHYYTAPEVDFGKLKSGNDDRSPREECCYIFDSLPAPNHEGVSNPENVLLVGYEYSLNIFHVDRQKIDGIGRLEGLRGSVIGAKILPSQPGIGHQASQPLVAVVIHGSCMANETATRDIAEDREDREFDPSKSMLQAMNMFEGTHFQTTVEVYSLQTAKHIATLFRSPKVEARNVGYDGQVIRPSPIGDLSVQANGRFIVVSSGTSGEVFMFKTVSGEKVETSQHFRCIGKVWTRTTPTSTRSMSMSSSESDPSHSRNAPFRKSETPILSLSHRWLAFVSPTSSAQSTLHGEVDVESSNTKVPGLSSHTAPAESQVTCDLDMPQNASVLNRVARDVAQGAMKSAQWVATEGYQAWQSYWNKPSEPNRHSSAGSPPTHDNAALLPPSQSFPPTHAQDNANPSARNASALVSILDLEKLSQSQNLKPNLALQPLATFSLPLGCSVLSFSPSGLNLLTANSKGDEQQVWDLMRAIHGETGRVGDPGLSFKGPSVRQIAWFSRVTRASIVDVIWTEPRGERFAIITEKSLHVFDLPSSAFQWPPSRRTQRSLTESNKANRVEHDSRETARPQSMGSAFGSALGLLSGTTQSVLGSVRGRNLSTGTGFPGMNSLAVTAGASAKGGKAVAAGINRSVSAAASGTVNTLRHIGDNRFSLPSSSTPISPGCARWLHGKDQGCVAAICGGVMRVRSFRQGSDHKAGQRRPSVIAESPADTRVPKAKMSYHNVRNDQRRPGSAPASRGSFWLPHSSRPSSRRTNVDTHPLSYAEIESNAPYQPFHTDRRVNLFVYKDDGMKADQLEDSKTWVFGGPIPATKISVGSAAHGGDEASSAGHGRIENEIRVEGNVEDGRQVVMTTRFKKNKSAVGVEMGDDDVDIFEDDCEVVDYADERV